LTRLERRCQALEFAVDMEDLSLAEALEQLRQAVIAAMHEIAPDANVVERQRIVPHPPREAEFEHIKLNIHKLIQALHDVYARWQQQQAPAETRPANVVPLASAAERQERKKDQAA
jgi:hypothetical protein